jgi:hypothetical protein
MRCISVVDGITLFTRGPLHLCPAFLMVFEAAGGLKKTAEGKAAAESNA